MLVSNLLFITVVALSMGLVMTWGFIQLPKERWQIFATIPLLKNGNGSWKGLNLTYYGIISANAYLFALAMLMILLGACDIPVLVQMAYTLPILAVAVPSARIVAWIVEKKSSTFTVGGAVFTAILVLPWVVMGINAFTDYSIDPFCYLAAVTIAYAFGEGLGRLACLSFGCCYGKSLAQSGKWMNRLFSKCHVVFYGKTKKIAYASHLDGEPMIPIQAITSLLYTGTALIGVALFLFGHFKSALFITLIVTQLWRVISEFFRADYRGESKFSAYQIMALVGIVYLTLFSLFQSGIHPIPIPQIAHGLGTVWRPSVILGLQIFWLITFLYTGRSFVTGSHIMFHVVKEKI